MYLPLDLRANIRIIQLFDVTDITASVMSSSKHSRHDIIIAINNGVSLSFFLFTGIAIENSRKSLTLLQ